MALFGGGFICGAFVTFVAMVVAALRANKEKDEDGRQDVGQLNSTRF